MSNVMNLTFPNTDLPFAHRLALGQYAGYRGVTVNGYNGAAPVAPGEYLWPITGTAPVFSATAIITKISAADVNDDKDDAAGAWTVEVVGLDLLGNELTQVATLEGRTAAVITGLWRVNSMKVLTAGTSTYNQGIIYAGSGDLTDGIPAVINAVIPATLNASTNGFYTIPKGYQGLITGMRWEASAAGDIQLYTRAVGGAFALQRRVLVPATVVSGGVTFDVPIVVAARGDIALKGASAATTIIAAASFDVILCPV